MSSDLRWSDPGAFPSVCAHASGPARSAKLHPPAFMPGGHVVIDLFDPKFEVRFTEDFRHMFTREVQDPVSGHRLRRTVVARDEVRVRQLLNETLRIEELDGDGNVIDSEESSWSLRWTMRQEMAYVFELSGFEPIEQYSDFRRWTPAYGREQLWVARATR